MPADDLVGGIALEQLSAGVPGRHTPVRVEQVDGVVLDRVDEQLEALGLVQVGQTTREHQVRHTLARCAGDRRSDFSDEAVRWDGVVIAPTSRAWGLGAT
jgi:hypothetical protein